MDTPTVTCQNDQRSDLVRTSDYFGLDYVEISPDQLTLTVVFLGRAPKDIKAANVQIRGGERITGIQVTKIIIQRSDDALLDDSMLVTLGKYGDYSTYQLSVQSLGDRGHANGTPLAGFDPRYASVEFTFKTCCPSNLDCHAPMICPPPSRPEPEINYLAKDYSSFRQLILDRLALIMPGWQERHVPDAGIALIEVLAYVGDYLSYYQDAVATEAYLSTARQRISVRRHARLVDYQMHDGCNARTWICLQPDSDYPLTPSDVCFLAGLDQVPTLANKTLLKPGDLTGLPTSAYEVFECMVANPATLIQLHAVHNQISFYTWGDRQCCLPVGATQAVLLDYWDDQSGNKDQSSPGRKLHLNPGDVIILEEVIGPVTGNAADADPSRRWPVRLTSVVPIIDSLIKTQDGRSTPLLEIEWAAADALPWPFCLSARLPAPDCRFIGNISVARGNVILVDNGQTLRPCEDLGVVEKNDETGNCACEGSVLEMTSVPDIFRPKLKQSPLTFNDPSHLNRPASKMLAQNPRSAKAAIYLNSVPPAPDGTGPLYSQTDLLDATVLANALKQPPTNTRLQLLYNLLSAKTKIGITNWDGTSAPSSALIAEISADLAGLLETWLPQRDLLESGPDDSEFVVEMDDAGRAHLRFGDGVNGRQPQAGMDFLASYRIGNGTAGNVSADRITKIMFQKASVDGLTISVRNPLPAQGGTEPEPVAEVKLFAPGAFKKVLERAITAADYSVIAGRNHKLQQAKADLLWTGSWYEARVVVDPLGSEVPDDNLLQHISGYLHRFRRVGHDLVVDAAQYVPLEIAMTICILPQYLRGHVEAALLDVFSNRIRSNGQLGFFHPDNLTFGEGVYLSQIITVAQAVPGVQSVKVTTFQRFFESANNELNTGVLTLGPMEIGQLDNDPNFPEHGSLTLNLRGGR